MSDFEVNPIGTADALSDLRVVLEEARAMIANERESMVECATLPPEHDVATLDPTTKPYVEEYDRALAKIDAALAKAGRKP